MARHILVTSLGLAIALGVVGTAQAQSRSRQSPAPERKSDEKAAAGDSQSQDTVADKNSPRDDASGKKDDQAATKKPKPPEKATFGGGCFWCMEAYFERIPGVKSVVSGYSGGHVPNPTYQMVCSGLTGHAEVIQIVYDPTILPFDKLLKYFWTAHDPTTLNSQGPDFGTQYRSVIFYHNEDQKEEARKQYKELMAHRGRKSPIVTDLVAFSEFYPAEDYHQDYYRNHPDADYSQTYIEPKVRKLRQKLKAASSTARETAHE